MRFRCLLLAAAFIAAVLPVARTDDKPAIPEGNWVLATPTGLGDQAVCLIKAEMKDGKLALTALASPPTIESTITDVKTDKGLSFKVKTVQTVKNKKTGKEQKFANERVFVSAPGVTGKEMLGSLGTDQFPVRAKLTATDAEKLPTLARSPAAPTVTKIQALQSKIGQAQIALRKEKDKEKKKELRVKVEEAQTAADEQLPGLHREIVKEYPDTAAALDSARALIAQSGSSKVAAAEATALTKLILKQADLYGPRFAQPTAIRLADTLVRQKGLEAVALIPIEPIAKSLKDKDTLTFQFDTLTTYREALSAAGRKSDLKPIDERLTKLDAALDKEWNETVPPFKPKAAGPNEGNRVAVMELFTGAQCGPCIAADVAFDAVHKAYQPEDLNLLQYHVHIPGPDPLTNPASVGRWDYYSELFPYDPDAAPGTPSVAGTPTTLFNGKPLAGGGGPMTNAENKFKEYRKIIDPLLEKTSDIKLTGTATRTGDKLDIAVELNGAKPAEGLKLRLLVVEDTIKYVGGNKIRFHHQVVRAMPGGVDGVAIKGASQKHAETVDVAAVRKGLTSYLDEFAVKQPFPYPAIRPMDMKDLKVIALVQNDETGEILQAVQFGSSK